MHIVLKKAYSPNSVINWPEMQQGKNVTKPLHVEIKKSPKDREHGTGT